MSEQTIVSNIPEDVWRAVISRLTAAGWSARTGGGLDFSWALLTRGDVTIDMEYDIWSHGDMAFPAAHAPAIRTCLPTELLSRLISR
jgi:hypothetical protein